MDKSKFARDWRNRHIAHRDLARAISEHAEPLMPASRAMVKEVLEALSNLLNAVAQHYLDTTTFFDAGTYSGDAQSLLYVLDDGISAEKARSERFQCGNPTPDDLKRRNLQAATQRLQIRLSRLVAQLYAMSAQAELLSLRTFVILLYQYKTFNFCQE